MNNVLYGADILTARQFTKEMIDAVTRKAAKMRDMVRSQGTNDLLKGKLMTALFYEPSSRTFGSFIAAMQRLGGMFVPLHGVVYSSVSKGESLPDTVSTFASYSDVIVIRYPHVGGAQIAASVTGVPVINAGDGSGEHPTQALLDMCTISNHVKDFTHTTITLVGDLLNGRTVHSLVTLLSRYSPKCVHLVAPKELQMPNEYVTLLTKNGITLSQTEMLEDVIGDTDVLYVTRVQKERFRNLDVYERLKYRYIITNDTMKQLKKTAILMHPFPRVGEIEPEVDIDPRAVYLREQIQNGLYVRMALLSLILKQ